MISFFFSKYFVSKLYLYPHLNFRYELFVCDLFVVVVVVVVYSFRLDKLLQKFSQLVQFCCPMVTILLWIFCVVLQCKTCTYTCEQKVKEMGSQPGKFKEIVIKKCDM